MVISVWRAKRLEGLAAIATFHKVYIGAVYNVFILGIDKYFCIVPGTLANIVVTALQIPRLPSISTHVEAAFLVLDDSIDLVYIRRSHGNTHDAPNALGQTFC